MIGYDIVCFGLSRTQLHTLHCLFPPVFRFYHGTADDLLDSESILYALQESWCMFVNPRKLSPEQLQAILSAHENTARQRHVSILLFTDSFTVKQKAIVDTGKLHHVDLSMKTDQTLQNTIRILRKAIMPSWNGMAKMRANVFNDGWYLLDMESSGTDPLESDVISLSLSYMAGYEILSTETFYIRQARPIPRRIEELTGITNQMLESGISKEEVVEHLHRLPNNAPLILESYEYYVPFLKALFHSCNQAFELPYITLDSLAAIAFGYMLYEKPYEILPSVRERQYPRTPVDNPWIAKLYDLTLVIFETLQKRYRVRAAGDLHSLYFSVINCLD